MTLWQSHGTKIIGYASALIGVIAALDQATIQVIESVLGPVYGPYFGRACLILAGIMVAIRGHKNTQDIAKAVVSEAGTGAKEAATIVDKASKDLATAATKTEPLIQLKKDIQK